MHIATRIQQSAPFFSTEFFPPKNEQDWPAFLATVEQLKSINPLFASVTYGAGGSTQKNTLEITSRIAAMNIPTMAHLTCVGASESGLDSFLSELRTRGVHNVLALRGDPPKGQAYDWNKGSFRHADDLVEFVRSRHPEMGLAVAGYPAPHPESPSFISDRHFTLKKIQSGADFIITQLFFDVREYSDLVKYLRLHDSNVPVIPGIIPIQSLDSVRRVLSMCGANIPGKFYLELEEAHHKGGAEAVREVGIAFALRQIRQLLDMGAPGIHLYTLNKADLCLRIANEVAL